jgi:4-amino-4-deoxy-L-arabinose transferase-like glycosyltransferase
MRAPLFPWQLCGLLALAFALRAGGAFWVNRDHATPDRFLFGDSDSYWQLGKSLATSGSYEIGDPPAKVFRTPGYPLVLAVLFRVLPDPPVLIARLWSAAWATLAVAAVYWLGERLFDQPVGLIAAFFVSIYPGSVAVSGLILSEGLFCAIVPLQVLCWQNGWFAEHRGAQLGWLFVAGVVGGLAAMFRPSWLLFTPVAISVGLMACAERPRQLRAAPVILVGLIVAMSPWWVRNYRAVGRFVPTTLQFGASLYDGINPQATGASNMNFTAAALAKARAAGVPEGQLEVHLNQQLRDESLAFARAHPGRVLKLALVKLGRMWNVIPNDAQFRSIAISLAVASIYVPLLALGLIGGFRYWRGGVPYMLCVLPVFYLSLLQMVFIGSIRYRLPAMLLLTVPAAAWLVETGRKRAQRNEANQLASSS